MATIGRRALSLEYLHAGDGKAYRHDFSSGATIEGNPDGSVTLRSREGKKLWGKFLTGDRGRLALTPFLENPPMRKRKHSGGRKASSHKRRGSSARKTSHRRRSSSKSSSSSAWSRGAPRGIKRPVPAGYSSWKEFMAHLRRLKGRRSNPGGSMAGKKRRSSGRRRTSSSGHHKRRRRTGINPPGVGKALRQAPKFALHVATMAAASIAGKIVARKLRGGVLKQQPGTMIGGAAEAAIGVVGGLAISMFSPMAGEGFAIGGVAAPLETFVQQRQISGISDALGDDGFYIGGNSGIGLISAFPDDYSNVVGDYGDLGRFSGYAGGRAGGSDIVAGYLNNLDNAAA